MAGVSDPRRLRPTPWSGPGDLRVTIDLDPPLVVDGAPDLSPAPDPSPTAGAGAMIHPIPPAPGEPTGVRRLEVIVDGWRFEATVESARRAALRERARRTDGAAAAATLVVRAPLPGRVVRVWVAAGDAVEKGSRLCSLEAMKMENEVLAHRAGTIERVSVQPGARVEHGDELVVIS